MISGPEDMLCSVARVDGYRSALERAGIQFNSELLRVGDFHVTSGKQCGESLLSMTEPPTAIFAGSDLQACGVYEAARLLGLRVPEDLSVVGYDDLRLARWVGPPLTTIRQPLTEMAETAVRLLLRMSDEGEPGLSSQRVDLATSLVVRESTRPPQRRPGRARLTVSRGSRARETGPVLSLPAGAMTSAGVISEAGQSPAGAGSVRDPSGVVDGGEHPEELVVLVELNDALVVAAVREDELVRGVAPQGVA